MNLMNYGLQAFALFVYPTLNPFELVRKKQKMLNPKLQFLAVSRNFGASCINLTGFELIGSGFRGGSWNNNSNNLPASNRNNASNTNSNRNNNYGFRGVRSGGNYFPALYFKKHRKFSKFQ